MLENSQNFENPSDLVKITKFCGDQASVWPGNSTAPPNTCHIWDKVPLMFTRFGGIIPLIALNILQYF